MKFRHADPGVYPGCFPHSWGGVPPLFSYLICQLKDDKEIQPLGRLKITRISWGLPPPMEFDHLPCILLGRAQFLGLLRGPSQVRSKNDVKIHYF